MSDFFRNLPKGVTVFALLIAGIIGVVFYEPIASVCDPQIANFQAQFVGDLYPYKVRAARATQTAPPRMSSHLAQCREGASSGACYQYFEVVRRILTYIQSTDEACYAEFQNVKPLYNSLRESLRLLLFFSWGDGPATENLTDIQGWLKDYELSTFCDVQGGLKKIMGEEKFDEFKWGMIGSLPSKVSGKELQMSAEQKAQRSLFRIPCNYF
ncbi:MAG: hypothetical protein ACK5P5_10220 [Pseudobdellovibrionaceae bacterium]